MDEAKFTKFGRYIGRGKRKIGSIEALCDSPFALEAEWYAARSGDFEVPERWVQRTVRLCRASMKLLDWPMDADFDKDIWEYTFQMKCAWKYQVLAALRGSIAV